MPQLHAADWAPQLIWLAITFIGLYLIMARVALPRFGQIIEQRRDRIANDLDQAARLKEQTEQAIAAYEADLAEARAKAHGIAQETRNKLNAETERQRAALEETLEAKTAEAEAKIKEAKEAAMAQVKDVAGETAEAIVAKLIGDSAVDRSKVDAAVTRTLGQ
jgi:F-type H+-transporting ATPase subunit b